MAGESPLDRWRADPDGTLGDLPSPEALDGALGKALAYAYLLTDGTPQAAEELVRDRLVALNTAPTDAETLQLVQAALDGGHAGFLGRLRRMLARDRAEELEAGEPEAVAAGEGEARPMALIGRDRMLVDKVARWAHRPLATRGEHTALRETRRGNTFQVKVGGEGEPATHVVDVTVELARVEQPEQEMGR